MSVQLSFLNVAILEHNKNGDYIYEYEIKKDDDIIENIIFDSSVENTQMKIIIGYYEYENNIDDNTFILCALPYSSVRLKFIFVNKPTMDDNVSISYKCYLLNKSDRDFLMTNKLSTTSHVYFHGTCVY